MALSCTLGRCKSSISQMNGVDIFCLRMMMILGVFIQYNTMTSSTASTSSNVGMIASASHLTCLPIWKMNHSVWCVAMHSKVVSNVDNISSLKIIIHSQILIIHIIAGVASVATTTRIILQHPLLRAGPSIPPNM